MKAYILDLFDQRMTSNKYKYKPFQNTEKIKFSFFLPLLIIFLSTNLLIFDQSFYKQERTNYELYNQEIDNLLEYFTGGELDKENYSEEEILHLADVKKLIWISLALLCLGAILMGISFLKDTKEHCQKECVKRGIYTVILIILLSFTFFNFSSAFTIFHKILFTNNYLLLPAESLLIQMFPERFFIESTKQIILYSLIFSILCIGIGCLPRSKKDEHKRT